MSNLDIVEYEENRERKIQSSRVSLLVGQIEGLRTSVT